MWALTLERWGEVVPHPAACVPHLSQSRVHLFWVQRVDKVPQGGTGSHQMEVTGVLCPNWVSRNVTMGRTRDPQFFTSSLTLQLQQWLLLCRSDSVSATFHEVAPPETKLLWLRQVIEGHAVQPTGGGMTQQVFVAAPVCAHPTRCLLPKRSTKVIQRSKIE